MIGDNRGVYKVVRRVKLDAVLLNEKNSKPFGSPFLI